MRIHYKKKHININLIFGIVWLVNGIIQVALNENSNWMEYIWFVLSGIYFVVYMYQKKEKYLTIENGVIKQNWPFGNKIKLTEIKQIKHFSGDYILKSDKKEMKINIRLIDENSMSDLKAELEKLNVNWN
jgi:hypothetical protein